METTLTREIQLDQVTKTYQGLDGCACGCRGSYLVPEGKREQSYDVESKAGVTRRLKLVNAAVAAGDVTVFTWPGEACAEWVNPGNGRVTRIYFAA